MSIVSNLLITLTFLERGGFSALCPTCPLCLPCKMAGLVNTVAMLLFTLKQGRLLYTDNAGGMCFGLGNFLIRYTSVFGR